MWSSDVSPAEIDNSLQASQNPLAFYVRLDRRSGPAVCGSRSIKFAVVALMVAIVCPGVVPFFRTVQKDLSQPFPCQDHQCDQEHRMEGTDRRIWPIVPRHLERQGIRYEC